MGQITEGCEASKASGEPVWVSKWGRACDVLGSLLEGLLVEKDEDGLGQGASHRRFPKAPTPERDHRLASSSQQDPVT